MTRDDFELLGDKHKAYESRTFDTILPGCPVVIRLDGKAFHTFTKGLARPFDPALSVCMLETTQFLVSHFNADVGYTQSDEISLGFLNASTIEPFIYSGRVQKLASLFAAKTSVKFNQLVSVLLTHKADELPVFDARVIQYPTVELATEHFLWRETDATRNSLTMAAHSVYSTKELHKAGYAKKHDMLHAKGINWNDYPVHFKRGVYFVKKKVQKTLTDAELARIPEKHRVPGQTFERSVVDVLDLGPLNKDNMTMIFGITR